ncbi:DUF805 domain-containing protein [Tropicibacter sp. Alg240-R139]|uniref:DUF805 domain-containing protein n=1 Tax=Tropicibacter sp. Alg240-R139 TaxID=2305991 RepID=UPI0013DEF86F|nr:DUF805 domain-containing protein [Tropicibacter sp. Alg240-R139]
MQASRQSVLRFSGRASRSEYWLYAAPILGLLVCALLYDLQVLGPVTYQNITTTTNLVTGEETTQISNVTSYGPRTASLIVAVFAVFPFSFMLTRRVHDIGYPGWYAWLAIFLAFFCGLILSGLVALIATVSLSLALVLGFLTGLPQSILSILAFVVIILWGTTPSEPGDNEYGPEPKGTLT